MTETNFNQYTDSKIYNKDIWDLIESYNKSDQNKQYVKHQIDSFNDFIESKISDIIQGFNPITMYHEYIPEIKDFKYKVEFHFNNHHIGKPTINEKDGSQRIMTPNEARQRNFIYGGTLYVDLNVIVYTYFNDEYMEEQKLFKGINIGNIPIMLHSKYCILERYPLLNRSEECKFDFGGYFIINGNEKVIVCQDRISENKPFVFTNNKSSLFSLVSEIRSVSDNIYGTPKITSVKLSSKSGNYGRFIRMNIHHIRHDIPLFIVFRALGIESDKEIIDTIVYEQDSKINKNIVKNIYGSVVEGNEIMTQKKALEYLAKYLYVNGYPKKYFQDPTHKIKILNKILSTEFLPHVGPDFKKKAIYVGYMVRKLLLVYLGYKDNDDRDSYINKKIDSPGI